MIGALSIMLPCCTKENNGGNNNGGESSYKYPWEKEGREETFTASDNQLRNKLLYTGWIKQKEITYYNDGTSPYTMYPNSSSDLYGAELSFQDDHYVCVNGQKKALWWIHYGRLYLEWIYYDDEHFDFSITALEMGGLAGYFGTARNSEIVTLTDNSLVWRWDVSSVSDRISCWEEYFTKSSGGGGGGGNSSYELPDIGLMDYDAWSNSIKVVYKIYNKEESQVSSAKVYYGTSNNPTSSVTATISGVLITARITGLTSGTKYYVKCAATGPAGTTTTPTTGIITFTP